MALVSLIAALSPNRVIGRANALPWRLPADLRRFRALTLGKPVVMGRKTFESIGRALPGRRNIVVTRDAGYRAPGATVVASLGAAYAAAAPAEEVMVIGGASIYEQALPDAARMYLTIVRHEFAGDAYFPEFDAAAWDETAREDHPAGGENPYPYSFLILNRKAR